MLGFSFDYELPPQLIAQSPCEPRDQARLLVVRRGEQSLAHHRVHELPKLLVPGDLLVLNDTRVLQARLRGKRQKTGGKWEGLFLRSGPEGTWEMLSQTGGRLRAGEIIAIEPGPLELTLVQQCAEGRWLVRPSLQGEPAELLDRFGEAPLPPYIRKGRAAPEDRDRYQTVFARQPGAVAAPTAGLHFTPELLAELARRGIGQCHVTLHVGLGTFQPMRTEDPTQHQMHEEWGNLDFTAVEAITACKNRGGHVVAIGTTSVRVLETSARQGLRQWSGVTNLFIYPPYQFRAVDALMTNFHLPHSTLLLLVAAFAGVELLERAYKTAIAESYRFYSYGDAMLIL